MTDRERINKAYGILFGATRGVNWIGDGKDPSNTRILVNQKAIEDMLDILSMDINH